MKACPTLECVSYARRTRSSFGLHIYCVQNTLKSFTPVVWEKQTFALSRDDLPLPAIPKFLLLGLNNSVLCFSILLGSRPELNGEFSCSLSLQNKRAPGLPLWAASDVQIFSTVLPFWNPVRLLNSSGKYQHCSGRWPAGLLGSHQIFCWILY